MSEIGNLARQHASDGKVYDLDFTTDLNWEAGDFGDASSCYWGGHSEAREWLMDEGGMAIRFYAEDKGIGRAWLVDRMEDDGFYIVFNGYGLSGSSTMTAARVLALYLNLVYKRVMLRNHGSATDILYINGGLGYLVGAVEAIEDRSEYDLEIGVGTCCHSCGDEIVGDAIYTAPDDQLYCRDCFYDQFDECQECGSTQDRDDLFWIDDCDFYVCERCYERKYGECGICHQTFRNEDLSLMTGHNGTFCEGCRDDVERAARQAGNASADTPEAPE